MRYLYSFINATCAVRIVDYLCGRINRHVKTVTVIYRPDHWILNVELCNSLSSHGASDCKAFLDENGVACPPVAAIELVLQALATGQPPTAVMNRYHVVIVSHGRPNPRELKVFRQEYIQGLGYCPPSLV